jgi:hypothetical protein
MLWHTKKLWKIYGQSKSLENFPQNPLLHIDFNARFMAFKLEPSFFTYEKEIDLLY